MELNNISPMIDIIKKCNYGDYNNYFYNSY